MGVFGLFSKLRSLYGEAFKSKGDLKIDTLCIDLNSIIHQEWEKIRQEISNKNKNSKSRGFITPEERIKYSHDSMAKIFIKIIHLVDTYQPSETLYLAIDGVVCRSKQLQQRERRYKATEKVDYLFDSNSISPGTYYMGLLSGFIEHMIFYKRFTDKSWCHLNVKFTSDKEPGEGEHKILEYMRLEKNKNIAIHGNDGDLIMLCLSLKYTSGSNVYIIREVKTADVIINITKLEGIISAEIGECDSIDFIIASFLLGNDFLPTVVSIDNYESIIETLKDFDGSLYERRRSSFILNRDNVIRFITLLFNREDNIVISSNNGSLDTISNYLDGIEWVFQYYVNELKSWDWYYSSKEGPDIGLMTNSIMYENTNKFNIKDNSMPVNIHLSLLYILPPVSFRLLPPRYHDIFKLPGLYCSSINKESGKLPLKPLDYTLVKEKFDVIYNKTLVSKRK